jgi:preprotein translocase subunit SecE
VARDRKRAKQRQARQARAAAQGRRADAATAPAGEREPERDLDRNGADQHETELDERHEHEPPELASGEVDLVDAQLALGRPELARESDAAREAPGDAEPSAVDDTHELAELADEESFEELEDEVDEAEAEFEGREDEQGEQRIARRRAAATTRREAPQREGSRVGNFLRGSWRELQRVQWPDRRQVAQATAVVVGFVIVAGAFLGLMDLLAGKIVELII